MKLDVNLKDNSYPIYIEENRIQDLRSLIDATHKVAIVTDSGVPRKWIDCVKDQFENAFVITVPQGEGSKCFREYEKILEEFAFQNMNRKDIVIAIGGGVVGDLAGFAAATYMRGIDFYNIPTTVLSQVDSSVGGKTAIDIGTLKNIVGAFKQPKAVFIDPSVLSTLDSRQINNGLVEALKMGLILDSSLVDLFEEETPDLEKIITRSIDLKRIIVEQDEKESSLRKILNFGHTIGHAIEGSYALNTYLHGECVGMGMLYFIEDDALKKRVEAIRQRLHQPAIPELDIEQIMNHLVHDKKSNGQTITVITVKEAGKWQMEEKTPKEIEELLKKGALA